MISKRKSWLLGIVAVAIVAGLSFSGVALAAKNKNKTKDPNRVKHTHGKVIAVVGNADGSGSITIEHHRKEHKKKAAANNKPAKKQKPEIVTKTFEVTAATQFVVREGKKGTKAARLSDIHKGEEVSIEHKKHMAEKVTIGEHKHEKKNKKAKKVAESNPADERLTAAA